MNKPPRAPNNGQLNGYPAAPPPASGGALYSRVPVASPSTVFPPELTGPHPRAVLYWLGWGEIGGQRLRRMLTLVIIAICLVLALLRVPGILWITAASGLVIALLFLLPFFYQRSHYVRFTPDQHAALHAIPHPNPLSPSSKIEVHVSGTLAVNGRRRNFFWTPGFYRTFATREHALLCLVRDRRILGIGTPPQSDVGLWYAFWRASQIIELTTGLLSPGREYHPGFRLVYQPADKKGRLGAPPTPDTLYIACADLETRERLLQDLAVELVGGEMDTDATGTARVGAQRGADS